MALNYIQNVILDFDGNLTDVSKEAEPVLEKFTELFAEKVGLPEKTVNLLLEEEEKKLAKDLGAGWMYKGQNVAPATVDPYVRTSVLHRRVLDKITDHAFLLPLSGTAPLEHEKDGFMQALFHESYKHSVTAFHKDADYFLAMLDAHFEFEVSVVTNSATDAVQKKLAQIGFDYIPVYGDAKKYVVSPGFDVVPEKMVTDFKKREVLLRRDDYYDLLQMIKGVAGQKFKPEHTLVMGDIFELDLALPLYLGYTVMLHANEYTPERERVFLANHPRGHVVNNLEEALETIDKL